MKESNSISSHPPLPHLARVVWLEARRKNEFVVFAILLGLYFLGALAARWTGIDSPATARFVRGLGLQLGALIAPALVIVMGARQIPNELELRTIYPVLAKPVSRAQFLLGKALPTLAVGVGSLALFTVVTLAITPSLPYQHAGVLAQALAAKALGLAALTALVFWLSLHLPAAVTMLIAAAAWFLGGSCLNLLIQAGSRFDWLEASLSIVPDFSLFDHLQRYVDGGAALEAGVMFGLVFYGVLWTAVFGALAVFRFRRISL